MLVTLFGDKARLRSYASRLVRWKGAAMRSPARANDVVSGMKPDQSKQLKIGQRVAWLDSETDQGTITASDWSGVRIAWDNGKNQFFHHNNMSEIQVARANLL